MTSISDERGQELLYAGMPISAVLEQGEQTQQFFLSGLVILIISLGLLLFDFKFFGYFLKWLCF